MAHGMAGIGCFWCIVEMLYENTGYLQTQYDRIAYELRIDENVIRSIINDFDLFKIEDDKFYSESALNQFKNRMSKSESARLSVSKRWEKYDRNTDVKKRNTKEDRIVKERVVKENINIPLWASDFKNYNSEIIYPFQYPEFAKAWDTWIEFRKEMKFALYKNMGGQAALKNLSEISNNDLQTAINIINQSISNGWRGLFALKTNGNGTTIKRSGKEPATNFAEIERAVAIVFNGTVDVPGFADSNCR